MMPRDTAVAWVQPWLVVCRPEASPRVVSAAWLDRRATLLPAGSRAALASCSPVVRADHALTVRYVRSVTDATLSEAERV